jgi:hypothetical protein
MEPFLILVFLTRRMTFHAILEIRDLLIQMPFNDLRLSVLVAAITGIGCKTGWMTGGTRCSAAMV